MSFDFLREILADLIDYDWYDYKSISDDKEYYYVAEVNENETNIKDNYKIVTTNKKNDDLFIEEVLGEDKLKDILPLFIKE